MIMKEEKRSSERSERLVFRSSRSERLVFRSERSERFVFRSEQRERFVLCLLALLLLAAASHAETRTLTLAQSIDIARERSYTMRNLQEDLKIADYNLKATLAAMKTHVDLGLTIPSYNQNIRTWEDSLGVSFYSVKRLDYSGTLTVNQPLITNGNVYWETGLNAYDDYNSTLRSSTVNTRLRFRQPIDALYGYNVVRANLKSARLSYERSQKSLLREELSLVYQVSSSYYNLLSLQRGADIAQQDLERQTEANDIAQNKYASGLIKEVDALQMEVDLAEAQNSYEVALINCRVAARSFNELLGIDLADSVILADDLSYEPIVVDEEEAVRFALDNRTELRDRDITIEMQELTIRRLRAEGMISGYLEAYVQRTGTNGVDRSNPFTTTLGGSMEDFIARPSNYGVGFTISVPIIDWGENKARVRAARSQQQQNLWAKEELQRSIEAETRNTVARLNNNLHRLQLLEKNVELAQKSFAITRQRFADGDIDSQTLALERNRLNGALRNHLSAYIDYQLSLADLLRKTLHDYRE